MDSKTEMDVSLAIAPSTPGAALQGKVSNHLKYVILSSEINHHPTI
jgi:hypothetical protein